MNAFQIIESIFDVKKSFVKYFLVSSNEMKICLYVYDNYDDNSSYITINALSLCRDEINEIKYFITLVSQ